MYIRGKILKWNLEFFSCTLRIKFLSCGSIFAFQDLKDCELDSPNNSVIDNYSSAITNC